jgi:hypothetical protein
MTDAVKRFTRTGFTLAFFASAATATGQSAAAHPLGVSSHDSGVLADSAKPRPRLKAIEYSDWYNRRLTIHRYGSYAMLPLFGAEYYLGEKLIKGDASDSEKSVHVGVATGIGVLFAVNTVTGAWNLWDSRKDPTDRTKRVVHSVLMAAADAGFALAAASAEDDEGNEREGAGFDQVRTSRSVEGGEDNNTHKRIAIASFGISTVGTVLMWYFK